MAHSKVVKVIEVLTEFLLETVQHLREIHDTSDSSTVSYRICSWILRAFAHDPPLEIFLWTQIQVMCYFSHLSCERVRVSQKHITYVLVLIKNILHSYLQFHSFQQTIICFVSSKLIKQPLCLKLFMLMVNGCKHCFLQQTTITK